MFFKSDFEISFILLLIKKVNGNSIFLRISEGNICNPVLLVF